MAFSHGQVSEARCTGTSSDKKPFLVVCTRVLAQRLTERQVLRLGLGR